MKKFLCLLMVAMLMLALSITAFARWEVCPECNGRMTERTTEKVVGTTTCPVTGDPDMQDERIKVTTTWSCTSCDYSESSSYTYVSCSH